MLERSAQSKGDVSPTSYKAAIEDSDLAIFIVVAWVQYTTVDYIAEKEVEECVKESVLSIWTRNVSTLLVQ